MIPHENIFAKPYGEVFHFDRPALHLESVLFPRPTGCEQINFRIGPLVQNAFDAGFGQCADSEISRIE